MTVMTIAIKIKPEDLENTNIVLHKLADIKKDSVTLNISETEFIRSLLKLIKKNAMEKAYKLENISNDFINCNEINNI